MQANNEKLGNLLANMRSKAFEKDENKTEKIKKVKTREIEEIIIIPLENQG